LNVQDHSDLAGSSVRRRALPLLPDGVGRSGSHRKAKQLILPQIHGTGRCDPNHIGNRGDYYSIDDSEADNSGTRVHRNARCIDTCVKKTRVNPMVSSRLGRFRSESDRRVMKKLKTRRSGRTRRTLSCKPTSTIRYTSDSDDAQVGNQGSKRGFIGDVHTSKRKVTSETGARPKRESFQG